MELVSRRRPARRVTLTPLIDVVFILLVFFMLQTNFLRPASLDLGTPGKAGGGAGGPAPIHIELHADGSAWLDGRRSDDAALADALAGRAADASTRVVLASDDPVPVQRIVRVLDMLNAAGLARVSLVRARRFEED